MHHALRMFRYNCKAKPAIYLRNTLSYSSLAARWNQSFPSILITDEDITARGSFAEAQAHFFKPDMVTVKKLDTLLHTKEMGIVAHYYMDPEIQGILRACSWPHIHIADSLAMGEAANQMVDKGVSSIAVLGVDFMSESVRATLNSKNHANVPVYRLSKAKIGCTLAEAAEKQAYFAYLQKAKRAKNGLHVVYINTSLRSKAMAHHTIPTITCTSSNVVYTILQAFAQCPEIMVWYGPDTYMGGNIKTMFEYLCKFEDEKIKEIHPKHNRETLKALMNRFHYFQQGNCIVHHMFGEKVTERVRKEYSDAFYTAHFEVPGEMFVLAMEAQMQDRGIVGSTSNILNFIISKTQTALSKKQTHRLQFILGTEVGMITSIVQQVQKVLQNSTSSVKPQVEIVFPVSADAVGTEDQALVPGVQGGEGCSSSGGCATCPYMKMNDIDSLLHIAESAEKGVGVQESLRAYLPEEYSELIGGKQVSDIGVAPILHMKYLMEYGVLSNQLVEDIEDSPFSLSAQRMQLCTSAPKLDTIAAEDNVVVLPKKKKKKKKKAPSTTNETTMRDKESTTNPVADVAPAQTLKVTEGALFKGPVSDTATQIKDDKCSDQVTKVGNNVDTKDTKFAASSDTNMIKGKKKKKETCVLNSDAKSAPTVSSSGLSDTTDITIAELEDVESACVPNTNSSIEPIENLASDVPVEKSPEVNALETQSARITQTLSDIAKLQTELPPVKQISKLLTELRQHSFEKGNEFFELYRKYGNPHLDESFLIPGVLACCKANKPSQGVEILRDILSQGRTVDHKTFQSLLKTCHETDAAPEAIELYKLMEVTSISLTLKDHDTILGICTRAEHLDGAILILKKLRLLRRIGIDTYMFWLYRATVQWRSDTFFELLMEMRLSDMEPEIPSLTSLESERKDLALTVMEGVRAVGLDPCFAMSTVYSSIQLQVYNNGPARKAITPKLIERGKSSFRELKPYSLSWPTKPIPQVLETQAAGLILQQETFRRLKMRQVHRIDSLLQMLPITTNLVINLRKQLLRMSLLVNTHRVKLDMQRIREEYESGKSLIELSTAHNYPPVSLLRIILRARGLSAIQVKYTLKEPERYLSSRDAHELNKAAQYDSIFKSDPFLGSRSFNPESLEATVADYVQSFGIRIKTEKELGAEQRLKYGRSIISPDILLLDPVVINGTPIRWMDAKNYYGAHIVSKRLIAQQLGSYVREWGPGAIVFGMGFSDKFSVPGVLCLDTTPFPTSTFGLLKMRTRAAMYRIFSKLRMKGHLGSDLSDTLAQSVIEEVDNVESEEEVTEVRLEDSK